MSDILNPPRVVDVAPPWISTFQTRNTYEILWSCIFTLTFSAWTMIHPGIPPYVVRKKKISWVRLFWVRYILRALLGLFWPEFILLSALFGYVKARQILKRLKEAEELAPLRPAKDNVEPSEPQGNTEDTGGAAEDTGESGVVQDVISKESSPGVQVNGAGIELEAQAPEPRPGSKGLKIRWQEFWYKVFPAELERGWYTLMGGYEFVGRNNDIGTLGPYAVVLLVAFGFEIQLSAEEIRDKSKSMVFTKLLGTGQALWMVVQVLVRKGAGLPITLLEFNTVLHVVCALIAYLLWLRKPKDIELPTEIRMTNHEQLTDDIVSLWWVRDIHTPSEQKTHKFPCFQRPDRILRYTHASNVWTLVDADNNPVDLNQYSHSLHSESNDILAEAGPNDTNQGPISASATKDFWQFQVKVGGISVMPWDTQATEPSLGIKGATSATFGASTGSAALVDEKFLLRFQGPMELTKEWSQFLVEFCILGRRLGVNELDWDTYRDVVNKSSILTKTSVRWITRPTELNIYRALENRSTIFTGLVWVFLSAIYGACHCATWNSYFPTVLERYLWRFSGITISSSMPVLILISACLHTLTPESGIPKPHELSKFFELRRGGVYVPLVFLWGIVKLIVVLTCGISIVVIFLLHYCARIYVIIEGFISLRSLPVAAYDNIRWLDIWPHF